MRILLIILLFPIAISAQTLNRGFIYSDQLGIIGDSTDRTTQIQAAINYASENKRTIRFKKGIYLINANLLMASNVTLEGEGDETEFKFTSGSSSPRYMFQGDAAVYSNITFRNLKINCNRSGNTGAQVWGIKFNNCSNLKFERVTFTASKGTANLRLFACTNAVVTNCTFDDDGAHSLQLYGGSDFRIVNNRFEDWAQLDSTKASISGYVNAVSKVQVLFNSFKNSNGEQFAIETAGAYMYNWDISHNQFEDDFLGGSGISGQFVNSTISFNKMIDGIGSQRSGIEISGHHIECIGNIIDGGNIIFNSLTNLAGFPANGTNVKIAHNQITTKGTNNGGICIAGKDSVPVREVDVLYNYINTLGATGNSSAIFVGTYGAPGIIKYANFIGNKIYSQGYGFRMQAAAGSSNIYIADNEIFQATNWMGYLTDVFSEVRINNNKSYIAKKDTIQYDVTATNPILNIGVENIVQVNNANYSIPAGINISVIYYNALTAERTVTLPDPATNTGRIITITHGGSGLFNLNLSSAVWKNSSTSFTTIAPDQSISIMSDGSKYILRR